MSRDCLSLENPIEDAVSRLRFSPKANNLLISSWDSKLRLYDVEKSILRLELPLEAALLDCCFENESACFSSDSGGFIRRYDLNAGTFDTIGKHDSVATCVGYSDEKGEVVSAGLDGKIRFWDARQEKNPVFVINTGADVGCVSVSGFDLVVCIGASILSYDLRNLQQPFQSCASPMDVPIRCVSSIPYSRGYVAGSVDGRVALDILDSSCSSVMNLSGAFVTGDNEGYVIAWDAQSRKQLFELPRYQNSVASLAFNHTGEHLAIASSHTYQEAEEKEVPPQVFIHRFDKLLAH